MARLLNKYERRLSLDAELVYHHRDEQGNARLCDCCGGESHIFKIEIKFKPRPSSVDGTMDTTLHDFVATWLTENALAFRGRKLSVVFEVSETDEEMKDRRFNEIFEEEYD